MSQLPLDVEGARVLKMRRQILNPWAMRAWMLQTLPLAWFAGLRVTALTADACTVTVPYGWRSQNPFRSTYFAAQAMAAEMSTGHRLMASSQKDQVSTPVVFSKRKTAKPASWIPSAAFAQSALGLAVSLSVMGLAPSPARVYGKAGATVPSLADRARPSADSGRGSGRES